MWLLNLIERCFNKFSDSYSTDLERYINSHNPQNEGDIERLTAEYHRRKYYY